MRAGVYMVATEPGKPQENVNFLKSQGKPGKVSKKSGKMVDKHPSQEKVKG